MGCIKSLPILAISTWSLLLAFAIDTAAFAFVNVIGGPEYVASTSDGYQYLTGWELDPFSPLRSVSVNDAGVAIGAATKRVAGTYIGWRAIQTNANDRSSFELGNLGTLDDGYTESRPLALNGFGVTVGYAKKYHSNNYLGFRAIRWDGTGSGFTELGTLWAPDDVDARSLAIAINDSGTAVGTVSKLFTSNEPPPFPGFPEVSDTSAAVRWDAASTIAQELPRRFGASEFSGNSATAINSSGVIVGISGSRAVRWDPTGTTITVLGLIGTGPLNNAVSSPLALNDGGVAVGWVQKYVDGTDKGMRAVRWNAIGTAASELEVLGTNSAGVTSSVALDVNERGAAVGFAEKYVGNVDLGERAVRWDPSNSSAIELGNFAPRSSGVSFNRAHAINDFGLVVGVGERSVSGQRPTIRAVAWKSDGIAIDLNDLIDPNSGWTLLRAMDVSNSGWIAGYGSFDPDGSGTEPAYLRSFLLQIPEPNSALLGAMAFFGVCSSMRRRT
jgi:hypothetical protein